MKAIIYADKDCIAIINAHGLCFLKGNEENLISIGSELHSLKAITFDGEIMTATSIGNGEIRPTFVELPEIILDADDQKQANLLYNEAMTSRDKSFFERLEALAEAHRLGHPQALNKLRQKMVEHSRVLINANRQNISVASEKEDGSPLYKLIFKKID